jgi:hypothetical protein
VQEAIYCLLMMQGDFIAPRSTWTELDPALARRDRDRARDDAGSTRCCRTASASAARTRRSSLSKYHGYGDAMPGLMAGKRGLVMGVANDHSIAWGIAKALADAGAELAFTYQGEAFGKRVEPLAASVGSDLLPTWT